MLDPITALGVAGNVVQFIDFGFKATSKTREIHRSVDGALEENVDLEVVTGDLAAVAQKLATHGAATLGSDGLDDICQRCTGTATELLTALEGFRVSGQKSRVKSVRKALKAIWGKRRVGEMRTRLEGYRDEIQFHVLVKLKYGFDVEATRQCERFDTLDAHAKAIFEAISQQQESIKDAIQIESLKSDDRHTNTITTIVAKQEEVYGEISRKLDETGELTLQAVIANGESVHNLISSEGSRSDERHRETTEIIVTKQTESHTEVIETLQSLDSTSRTEQEATRREVEELKKAMKQIEEDMKRRDEELKELLQALSRTQNDLERKGLRERSNAVTVALVALMTIHETLQQMLVALQAHTKHILTSASIKIWGAKSKTLPEITIKRPMLDAIVNKPTWLTAKLAADWVEEEQIRYSRFLSALFSPNSCALHCTWTAEFYGWKDVDFEVVSRGASVYSVYGDGRPRIQEISHLAALLDSRLLHTRISDRDIEVLKSLIILVTFLSEIHTLEIGSQILISVLNRFELHLRLTPGDIFVWSTLGEMAGFKRLAAQAIERRLRKWGAPRLPVVYASQDPYVVATTKEIVKFIIGNTSERFYTFSIGGTAKEASPYVTWSNVTLWGSMSDATRALPALHYVFIEYLIEFGFPLHPPVIEVDPRGLKACVEKKNPVWSQLEISEYPAYVES